MLSSTTLADLHDVSPLDHLQDTLELCINEKLVAKKRYQAVGFPCNRMLKLSSSRGIRIDVPVLSVSWSFVDLSLIHI